jgi:hypothetical protein
MIRSGPFVCNEGCGLEGSSPSETASPSQDALQGTVPLVVSCIVFVGVYLDLISGENKPLFEDFAQDPMDPVRTGLYAMPETLPTPLYWTM